MSSTLRLRHLYGAMIYFKFTSFFHPVLEDNHIRASGPWSVMLLSLPIYRHNRNLIIDHATIYRNIPGSWHQVKLINCNIYEKYANNIRAKKLYLQDTIMIGCDISDNQHIETLIISDGREGMYPFLKLNAKCKDVIVHHQALADMIKDRHPNVNVQVSKII
jgi:hypothetical protein